MDAVERGFSRAIRGGPTPLRDMGRSAMIMELPIYLLNALIIRSASAEVTVSLGPSRPSAGTKPF